MSAFLPGTPIWDFVQRTRALMDVDFDQPGKIVVCTSEPFSDDDKQLWNDWYAKGWPSREVVWK